MGIKVDRCLVGLDGLGGVMLVSASDQVKQHWKDTGLRTDVLGGMAGLMPGYYDVSVRIDQEDCTCGDPMSCPHDWVFITYEGHKFAGKDLTFAPMNDRDRAETEPYDASLQSSELIVPEPVSTPSITGESAEDVRERMQRMVEDWNFETGEGLPGELRGRVMGMPVGQALVEVGVHIAMACCTPPPGSRRYQTDLVLTGTAEGSKAAVWRAIGGSHEVTGIGQRDGLDIRPGGVRRSDAEDAARYRWLRSRDVGAIGQGGVFAGLTPDNLVLSGVDLDRVVDEARGHDEPVDLDAVLIQGLDRALEAAWAEGNQSMIDTFTHMKAVAERAING